MKKIVTILMVLISMSAYSQNVDTVKNSIQIQPIVTNTFKNDTAYQLFWRITVDRGNTSDGFCYVSMHDRFGNKVQDFNLIIPAATMQLWTDDKVIDDFIINKYKLKYR